MNVVLVHSCDEQEDRDAYCEVVKLEGGYHSWGWGLLLYVFRSFSLLWRYRDRGYVFHGLDVYSPIFIPAIIAKLLGYSVCLKAAAAPTGFTSSKNSILLFLRRIFANQMDLYFVISEEIYEELKGVGISEEKLILTYNGVDHRRFKPSSSYPCNGSADRKLSLLFTGALCRRKRPHLLLEAMSFAESRALWRVIFVGPFQEEDYLVELKELSQCIGMKDDVKFEGYQRELGDYYSNADVYGLPSLSEGMPNGVLEAMSCGLPIVISSFSSSRLLCDGSNGFIANTSQEFAAALDRLAFDGSVRGGMGMRSRMLVESKFSMQSVGDLYYESFVKLLAR